jgi:hypothetical protein
MIEREHMGIGRPVAPSDKAAEELQSPGFNANHVEPLGATDRAVGHVPDEIEGVPFGSLVSPKLKQVVILLR